MIPSTVARTHGAPFFSGRIDQNQLISEAISWLGTPFHPHGHIKYVGVDCVNLAAGIYQALGVVEEFNPPKYALKAGHVLEQSQITEYLEQTGRFHRLSIDQGPMTGDLLCFRVGKVEHHVGVLLRWPSFIHVLRGYPVMTASLYDPTWEERLTSTWRPLRK